MDIHEKSVDMDMDMDVIFHIHGNPAHNSRVSVTVRSPCDLKYESWSKKLESLGYTR